MILINNIMKKFNIRKVDVSDFINVLIEAEKDGVQYIDLQCTIGEDEDSVEFIDSYPRRSNVAEIVPLPDSFSEEEEFTGENNEVITDADGLLTKEYLYKMLNTYGSTN